MNRLFVPTVGAADWRRLLADPVRQWKARKSALESAVAWEAARGTPRGLPPEIAAVMDTVPDFEGATLLFGIPEHQVALAGGGHASQTDLWALVRSAVGLASVAVEAKAGEPFDRPVREWLSDASPGSGKPVRLRELCAELGLAESDVGDVRYQLMHRPVATLLEARRFGIGRALFLVHAFGDNASSWTDYAGWASLLGVSAREGLLQLAGRFGGTELWIGWVGANYATDAMVRAAL